jgi:hypothetical protein
MIVKAISDEPGLRPVLDAVSIRMFEKLAQRKLTASVAAPPTISSTAVLGNEPH